VGERRDGDKSLCGVRRSWSGALTLLWRGERPQSVSGSGDPAKNVNGRLVKEVKRTERVRKG